MCCGYVIRLNWSGNLRLAFLCTIRSSTKVLWICSKRFFREDWSFMWLGFQLWLGVYGKDGIS